MIVLVGLAGSLLVVAPASAETGTATVVPVEPGPVCRGDAGTLTWSPAGVEGLTGYQVVRHNYATNPPTSLTTYVGPDETSLTTVLGFFVNTFLIRPMTAAGVGPVHASAVISAGQAPMAMYWDDPPDPGDVGDGRVDVRFAWPGPVKAVTTGGMANTVRITASPGGATIDVPVTGYSAEATFTGLTNGVGYRFTAVTFNACGTGGSDTSTTYVPGVRPAWTQASPPLTVRKNKTYSYQFAASGTPTPTYHLAQAPDWLSIGPDGVVTGEVPKGVTSFTYSVVAENGVGIAYPGLEPPVTTGPFTVTVTRGSKY